MLVQIWSCVLFKVDSDGSIVPCLFSVVSMPIKCFLAEAAIVALQDLLSH